MAARGASLPRSACARAGPRAAGGDRVAARPLPGPGVTPPQRPAPLRSPGPLPALGAYPCWRLRRLPATGERGVQVGGIRAKVLFPVTRFPGPAQHLCSWRCAGGAAGLHPWRRWNGRGRGRRPLSPRGGTPVGGPRLDSAPGPRGPPEGKSGRGCPVLSVHLSQGGRLMQCRVPGLTWIC